MKRFLRSKLFLTLAALVMIAAGIVVPLSGHIPHSHATAPSSPSVIATIPVSNEPTGIAVNPNINRIYVGHGGSEIAVIDGVKDTLLTTITTGNNHINMAVNPITNVIYATNQAENTISVIDGLTYHVEKVAVGNAPHGIAVNPVTNTIYVGNRIDSTVSVIDGASNTVTTTIPLPAIGLHSIAVNTITNTIYVTQPDSDVVSVIDGAKNTVSTISLPAGSIPIGIGVNEQTNRIYVGNASAGNVTVIDGTKNTIEATIPTGSKTNGIAINPLTNRIYAAVQGESTVAVIDGITKSVKKVPVGQESIFVATNPNTNRVYVSAQAEDQVYVVDDTPPLQAIALSVTPKTPIWKMDAQVKLNPTEVSCPSSLIVTVGQNASAQITSSVQDVCSGQAQAPSQTHVLIPVFDNLHPSNTLTPGSSAVVTAQLIDSSNFRSSLSTTGSIPPAPIWIGLGDSYSSGHHQDENSTVNCPFCGLYRNDEEFSWVTRAATLLNNLLKVPTVWQITANVQAQSGKTTGEMVSEQMPNITTMLKSHAGSWNIVSFTGGGNDMNFSGPLETFYGRYFNLKNEQLSAVPWDVQTKHPRRDCLDTEAMWQTLNQNDKTVSKRISVNLQNIISTAVASDPNIRLVDVNYPYVMDPQNICSKDTTDQRGIWHGSKSTIDALDDSHKILVASNNNLVSIDLRTSADFTSPLVKLQLIYFFGYPHPNDDGQSAIAILAVVGVVQLHP